MKTECPHCGQHYEVEENFAGQNVECSQCGKEFEVKAPCTPVKAPIFNPTAELWRGQPAVVYFLLNYLIAVLLLLSGSFITICGFFAEERDNKPILWVWGGMIFFLGIAIILGTILSRKFTSFSLTRSKLISKSGVLVAKEISCNLEDVRNITITQSLLERIVGCGKIEISSAATTGNASIRFWGIQDFREVAELIERNRKK